MPIVPEEAGTASVVIRPTSRAAARQAAREKRAGVNIIVLFLSNFVSRAAVGSPAFRIEAVAALL
jgi:hypothetical protein